MSTYFGREQTVMINTTIETQSGQKHSQDEEISLQMASNGDIFFEGSRVASIASTFDGAETSIALVIEPAQPNVDSVTIGRVTSATAVPEQEADSGGVRWSAENGNGQRIELFAPGISGSERQYFFDPAGTPVVRLQVTILRS